MRPVNDSDTNFHNCHECGKREKWNDNWSWAFEFFGKGYSGWEIDRCFCSDICYNNWKNKKKKQNIK
jgi:hypothetical protein